MPSLVLCIAIFLVGGLSLFGCTEEKGSHKESSGSVLVFKHGRLQGDPGLFRTILDRFEALHPNIRIRDETLPSSTDEQHQYYVINLEAGSRDFDVLSMDVIWVPEFARAGWIRDLSRLVSEEERARFFPGPMKAVMYGDRLYAIPWYIDAGVLYYRKDLLEKYGLSPPRFWNELVRAARDITPREEDLYGYIWQGKQYEGLVCNVLEYLWGNGGEVLHDGKLDLERRENAEALSFVRDLIGRYRVTPPLVTTADEETTRQIFGNGRALFMRNWPYAWNIFNSENSPLKGKVGIAPLPSFPGHESASALGGWQLGINRFSREPEAAEKLVRFLTSPEVQKSLALGIGYKPSRRSLYHDRELIASQPFTTSLYDIFMKARPRPVSPYYMMMTQIMQPEFSAVILGIQTPEAGLRSMQRQIRHLLEAGR